MPLSPLAGKLPPKELLIDPAKLEQQYYQVKPDPKQPTQRVSFGTSGHRGTPENGSFNEAHILAITQAICEYRKAKGIDGPLFLGKDTHAPTEPATSRPRSRCWRPTASRRHRSKTTTTRRRRSSRTRSSRTTGTARRGLADGIVVTPSHNPPRDGGFKYNPPNGGPADTDVTEWIQDRANALLEANNAGVKRCRTSGTSARDDARSTTSSRRT